MLPNNAMGSANDSFSVLEALGVEDKTGQQVRGKGRPISTVVCPRAQAFKDQKDALELDPLVFDWDKTCEEVEKCLGYRVSDPVAFNTVIVPVIMHGAQQLPQNSSILLVPRLQKCSKWTVPSGGAQSRSSRSAR